MQKLRTRPKRNRQAIANLGSQPIQQSTGDAIHARVCQHEGKDDVRIARRRDTKLQHQHGRHHGQRLAAEIVDHRRQKRETQHPPFSSVFHDF